MLWALSVIAAAYPCGGRCSTPRNADAAGVVAPLGHADRRVLLRHLAAGVAVSARASPLLFAIPWIARGLTTVDRLLVRGLLGPTRTSDRVDDLEATRAQAVDHSAATLRRIERDLHDGTQARLVALAMHLDMARDQLATWERARPRATADLADAAFTDDDLPSQTRAPAPASCSNGPTATPSTPSPSCGR